MAPLFCFRYSDLLISAPYHGQDEGRVYVYINDGNVSRFELLNFFSCYLFFPKAFTNKCIEMIFQNPSLRILNKNWDIVLLRCPFLEIAFFSTGNLVSTTRLFVFLDTVLSGEGREEVPLLPRACCMPPFGYCLICSAHNGDMQFKQPRRLWEMKRHLKRNICALVTILRLLLFVYILSCWQTTLKLDWTGITWIKYR